MTCGIDEILENTEQTLQETVNRLVQDLAADYSLELESGEVANAPETRTLVGALQTYAVWLIHGRANKS